MLWGLGLGLCGLLCAAEQQRCLPDALALHQRLVERPPWQVPADEVGLVKPSSSHAKQATAALSTVTSKSVDRLMTLLNKNHFNLPGGSLVKWAVVGKLTQWAVESYERPKTPARMDLAEGILALLVRAFDTRVGPLSDKELLAKILDWASIQELGHRYFETSGQLPEFTKLVDSIVEGLKERTAMGRKALSLRQVGSFFNGVFEKMKDEPVTALVRYSFSVLTGQEHADLERLLALMKAVFSEAGAPPAVMGFARDWVEDIQHSAPFQPKKLAIRASYALSNASAELNLPPSFQQLFQHAGSVFDGTADDKTLMGVAIRQAELLRQAGEAVGVPEVVTRAAQQLPKCVLSIGEEQGFWSCATPLVLNASAELGEPSIVTEFLARVARGLEKQDLKPRELIDETLKLAKAGGAFPDLVDYVIDLRERGKQGPLEEWQGLDKDKDKFLRNIAQMVRVMGMPSLSTLLDRLLMPWLNKAKPAGDAQLLGFLAVCDFPGEYQRMKASRRAARRRLLGPVDDMWRRAAANLSGHMPRSFLAASLAGARA